MDIVVLNDILQDLRECQNQQVEIIIHEHEAGFLN
jgi:hypothetical protein